MSAVEHVRKAIEQGASFILPDIIINNKIQSIYYNYQNNNIPTAHNAISLRLHYQQKVCWQQVQLNLVRAYVLNRNYILFA